MSEDNPAPVNPYVGPRPFQLHEGRLFFGRDWESEELVALVVAHPVGLLYAQSGAGKSSLLNARIIPKLEIEENCDVLPVTRVRGEVPPRVQPDQIKNIYIFNSLLNWTEETASPPGHLGELTLADFLQQLPRRSDGEGYPVLRVLIFDQFEELFTSYPARWPEREKFFNQVNEALARDDFLRALFVIREDYLAQLDPYASLLPEQLRARFRLEPLRQAAALAAVKGPLQETARSFAPGVAETLVNELLKIRVEDRRGEIVEATGEFVEPVQLQVVCQGLWEQLPPDVVEITEAHLSAFGSVDQALTRFYERAVRQASQRTQVWEWRLRLWFEREFITPAGTRALVYRGRERTEGIPNQVVDYLESQHLIRGERRAGSHWYELTHDRLIGPIQQANRDWWFGSLKKWLPAAAGIGLAMLIALAVTMGLFAQLSARANQVVEAAANTIATSTAAAQVQEATVQIAQETAQAAREGLATSTAVAENVGKFVDAAQATAQAAEARQATAEAVAAASAGVDLLPAEVSTAIAATGEAARAAAATAADLLPEGTPATPEPTETATPTPTPLPSATPTPTGDQLEVPEPDGTVEVPGATPIATPKPPLTWPPRERIVFVSARLSTADLYRMDGDGSNVIRLTTNVAFDPSYSSGRDMIVFATVIDNRASLYTISPDGGSQTNVGGREYDSREPSFAPAGRRVAFVSSRDGGSDIYSLELSSSQARRLTEHPDKDYSPAWSADGRRIAFVSDRSSQADIWTMSASGLNQARLTSNQAQDVSPDWSPDGQKIVFVSTRMGNADIYVMDADGRNQRNLTNSIFDENYPAWSLDGNWLAFSRYTTNNEIFIMTIDGVCPAELPQTLIVERTGDGNCLVNLTNNNDPDWSPIWIP